MNRTRLLIVDAVILMTIAALILIFVSQTLCAAVGSWRDRREVAPLIIVDFGESWEEDLRQYPYDGFVIGSSRNGEWLSTDAFMPGGTRTYSLYSQTRSLGAALGSEPFAIDGIGNAFLCLSPLSDQSELEPDSTYVGIDAAWNAFPRTPTILSPTDSKYSRLVESVVDASLIERGLVDVLEVLVGDIDGDGSEEALFVLKCRGSALDCNSNQVMLGADYLLVLTRQREAVYVATDSDQGSQRTATDTAGLSEYQYTEVRPLGELLLGPEWHLVDIDVFLLDANGDGCMEIVVSREYYEWWYFEVWDISGGTPSLVLHNVYGL